MKKVSDGDLSWLRGHCTAMGLSAYPESQANWTDLVAVIDELRERRREADERLVIAFVQGAKWWEYEKTKFTMWPSDQCEAEKAAIERLENNSLGVTHEELKEEKGN